MASLPSVPNYTNAATQQQNNQYNLNQQTTQSNRVNQYTPFGYSTYQQDPNNPNQWSQTIGFSPNQQAIQSGQDQLSMGLLGMANGMMGRSGGSQYSAAQLMPQVGGVQPARTGPRSQFAVNIATPQLQTDLNSAYQGTAGWDKATDAIMSRVNPQFDLQSKGLAQQLANQGITLGSEAWKNAQDDLSRARNDATQQAILSGLSAQNTLFGQDVTAANFHNNALQGMFGNQTTLEQLSQGREGLANQRMSAQASAAAANAAGMNQSRALDLQAQNDMIRNLLAIKNGAQATMPNFPSVPQQQNTAGADYLAALNAGYNANIGQYNANTAGRNNLVNNLFGLGGAVLQSDKAMDYIGGLFG